MTFRPGIRANPGRRKMKTGCGTSSAKSTRSRFGASVLRRSVQYTRKGKPRPKTRNRCRCFLNAPRRTRTFNPLIKSRRPRSQSRRCLIGRSDCCRVERFALNPFTFSSTFHACCIVCQVRRRNPDLVFPAPPGRVNAPAGRSGSTGIRESWQYQKNDRLEPGCDRPLDGCASAANASDDESPVAIIASSMPIRCGARLYASIPV